MHPAQLGLEALAEPDRCCYIAYADALSRRLTCETRVSFPLPPRAPGDDRCPAEHCAEAYLREGTGTLWTAVRDVIALLPLSPDNRDFADGLCITLGAYRKGGILDSAATRRTCRQCVFS